MFLRGSRKRLREGPIHTRLTTESRPPLRFIVVFRVCVPPPPPRIRRSRGSPRRTARGAVRSRGRQWHNTRWRWPQPQRRPRRMRRQPPSPRRSAGRRTRLPPLRRRRLGCTARRLRRLRTARRVHLLQAATVSTVCAVGLWRTSRRGKPRACSIGWSGGARERRDRPQRQQGLRTTGRSPQTTSPRQGCQLDGGGGVPR